MTAVRNARVSIDKTQTRLGAIKSALESKKKLFLYAAAYKKVFPKASMKICIAMAKKVIDVEKNHFRIRTQP